MEWGVPWIAAAMSSGVLMGLPCNIKVCDAAGLTGESMLGMKDYDMRQWA
jgi:hypothetical protein